MEIITLHNLKFGLDVSDWTSEADKDAAAEGLYLMIQSWSANHAARIHRLLMEAQSDDSDIDWDHDELDQLGVACAKIRAEVMKDWAKDPAALYAQDGIGNCSVLAC